MSDEFLTDDFFLKLIRLGVEDPELRHPSRIILQKLNNIKKEREETPAEISDKNAKTK